MKKKFSVLFSALMMVAATSVVASFAQSQPEETDEARAAMEKAKHRRYPGGRDEQELTVQTVLPVVTRYPESPKAAVAPTPESDTDIHD